MLGLVEYLNRVQRTLDGNFGQSSRNQIDLEGNGLFIQYNNQIIEMLRE